MFICSAARECELSGYCASGKPHEKPSEASEICFDKRPHEPGGRLVWDEVVEVEAPPQAKETHT